MSAPDAERRPGKRAAHKSAGGHDTLSVRRGCDFQQPPLFPGFDVPVQRTPPKRRRPAAPPADGWSRTVARQKCHACLIRLGEVDGPAPLVRTARFVWRDGGHATYLCPDCAEIAGYAPKAKR